MYNKFSTTFKEFAINKLVVVALKGLGIKTKVIHPVTVLSLLE